LSDSLLVPITADALLVNNAVRNSVGWQRFTLSYGNLNTFEDPVPAPGQGTEPPPGDGVYLHWKLPAAITHGRQDPSGQVKFDHLAPNRWLVVRLADGAQPVAWVVQSDYLGSDGTTPYADPHSSTPGNVVLTQLGRNMALDTWNEPGGNPFLKATGLADATFTAWQPGLQDVFSFHDRMAKVAENTTVSYLIAGWYSEPSADPLATDDPAKLGWTVLGGDETPTRSVYHSLVMDLTWQTSKAPPRADSDASSMQVAVAYTAVDALAATVAALEQQSGGNPCQAAKLATALEAFQRGLLQMLDKPGGAAALEQDVRASWFAGSGGGTVWNIVSVAQGQATVDPLDPTVQPLPPVLSHDQEIWLAALNVHQRAYDEAKRALETAQWELFALWWKDQLVGQYAQQFKLSGDNPDTNPAISVGAIKSVLDAAVARAAVAPSGSVSQLVAVERQQLDVASKRSSVPDPASTASISDWSKKIPANSAGTLALRPRAMQPFMRPVDPVVLVAGITPPAAEPDARGGLPCRLATAAVTGVEAQGQRVTAATGSLDKDVPTIDVAKLDPAIAGAVSALATESFFADSANAALILRDGLGVTDPNAVKTLTTAMAAGTAQISTIAKPLQATWAFQTWSQAWAPLFLQWEIDWRATLEINQVGRGLDDVQDNWQHDPTQWSFDGRDDVLDRGGEYYAWCGPDNWSDDQSTPPDPGAAIPPNTYTGRTFLTAHATAQLIERLDQYVKLHPDADLEQIEKLIDKVGETRFLSQALSGFNDAFLTRALQHTPPPDRQSPLGKAVAGEHRGVPVPSAGATDMRFGGGTPFFFPLRGGFFQFNTLEIVDSFGQVLDLLRANGNAGGTAATFKPIRGQGLAPDANATLPHAAQRLKQAPRVVQPSRLVMRLLDHENDADEVGLVAVASPICGWLLPNHLDKSIAAYDPTGTALGELLVAVDPATDHETVRWLPAPGGDAPADPSQITSRHLREALTAFTDTSGGGIPLEDRPTALRALYASIDETLWTIEPGGGQGDQDLAALIGPPLALVRAELQFELYGRPAFNQSWRDSTLQQTACFTTVPLAIRVGSTELIDDGVVGYYTGDTYTEFSVSHLAGPKSPHVLAIAPGNYLSLPFDYPTYSRVRLTLLVDPRGSVHATTGVLPITEMRIPAAFYEPALATIAATFRIGPVLTDPVAVRMPIPADRRGTWSWIARTTPGNTAADFASRSIVAADGQARLQDAPPHMVDGWLRFAPDDVEG
jgi:hypothetical protein